MARTPLFSSLQRCLRTACQSLRTGVAGAELAEAARERRQARRRFLQQSAAAAAGLAAGCHFVPPRQRSSGRVLVIGAGIAGLVAAYRLQQAGVNVQLLEAQERAGGRMYSIRNHFAHGHVAELGAELIDTDHTHMQSLARELGLPLEDLLDGDNDALIYFFDGQKRSEKEVLAAFQPVATIMKEDIASLRDDQGRFKRISFRDTQGAEQLDRLSMAEWLDMHQVTGWFRKLLDVGYTTEMGVTPDKLSALELLMTTGTADDVFEIYGDSDERYHVHGGNDRITSALRERLGSSVRLGQRLEAVRRRPDGMIEISVRDGNVSRTLAADHVILALPFTLLREVKLDDSLELPAQKKRVIAKLPYGNNAKLMLGFQERVWRTKHGASGEAFADLGFQSCWETSRQQVGQGGIITNFTGGPRALSVHKDQPAREAARVCADLEQLFPGVTAAHDGMHALFHWPTQSFAKCSFSALGPGDWTTLRGAAAVPVANLHFAGEHCSIENHSFMEGGCESGEQAAREVIAALNL